jgi:hypothetical protein
VVEFEIFGSFEEMMEAERKAREAADARVESWQLKARSGDILVSMPYEDLPVFHELLDNEKIVRENLWKYGDDYEEEGIYTLDIYNEPHMKNYRFCRNYSEVVPEGELGDIHLSIAICKISREYFNELKERRFRVRDE